MITPRQIIDVEFYFEKEFNLHPTELQVKDLSKLLHPKCKYTFVRHINRFSGFVYEIGCQHDEKQFKYHPSGYCRHCGGEIIL